MQEIQIGLLARLPFYLQGFGNPDLCVLLRSAEAEKRMKNPKRFQFAHLKRADCFGRNIQLLLKSVFPE